MPRTKGPMQFSDIHSRLQESATLAMARRSRELKASGVDVVNLSLGEPDFNVPDFIKEAATQAIKDNWSKYPPVNGFLDLREAISKKFARDNSLKYSPDQIVVSTGAKQSIFNIVISLINAGDEVILPAPYWVTYYEQLRLVDASIKVIDPESENNSKITPEQLSSVINENSKLFIFSSPCNPTGAVYSRSELEALAEVFKQFPNCIVVSDEIYEHINFTYDVCSIGSVEGMQDQTITVNGLSKAFAMTGWRIGYIGAPLEIAKACSKIQGQCTSGTNAIAQRAALAAIEADPSVTAPMREEFKARRELVVSKLQQINGFALDRPDGAFYVMPDVSALYGKSFEGHNISSSKDFSELLLDHAHVAVVSGEGFGAKDRIRISYASSQDLLNKALTRIADLVAKLQ